MLHSLPWATEEKDALCCSYCLSKFDIYTPIHNKGLYSCSTEIPMPTLGLRQSNFQNYSALIPLSSSSACYPWTHPKEDYRSGKAEAEESATMCLLKLPPKPTAPGFCLFLFLKSMFQITQSNFYHLKMHINCEHTKSSWVGSMGGMVPAHRVCLEEKIPITISGAQIMELRWLYKLESKKKRLIPNKIEMTRSSLPLILARLKSLNKCLKM